MRPFILFLILFHLSYKADAQERELYPRGITNENKADILLYKSRQQKTKGIITLVTGPLLTAMGVAIVVNENNKTGLNGISPNQTAVQAGNIISLTGIVTTFFSLPYFISSGKSKREARLLLKKESSYLPLQKRSLAAVGISIHL